MNSKRTIIVCQFSKADSFDPNNYCLISISWFPPENWQGKSYGSLMMVSKKQEALALEIPSDDIRGLSLEQLRAKKLNDITMWRYLKHYDNCMNKIFEDIFKLSEDKIPVLMWRESKTSKASEVWYYHTTCELNNWLENHPEFNYEMVWADTDEWIEKVLNDIALASEKSSAIAVLKEFNEWRRGQGEYTWNEDPSKNKDLEITPKQIGEAIDFAVEFLENH